MRHAGIRVSLQLAVMASLGFWLAGCSTRHYFVANVPVEFSDEEHDALFSKVEALEPGMLAVKAPAERQWTFYSGKELVTGSLIRSGTERERLELIVRDGWIISAHRNIQMIRVRTFLCGNISGHGDFCGTTQFNRCEVWGNHTLRKSCPIITSELPAGVDSASAAAARPFVQQATVHTAGPPKVVFKNAGDPVATGAPQK